jgi:hypothetical protein
MNFLKLWTHLDRQLRHEFKLDNRHTGWTGWCSDIPDAQDSIFVCLSSNLTQSQLLSQQFRKYKVPSVLYVFIHVPVLKYSIFCNITPYSPLKVNRHFGVAWHLYFECRRKRKTRNQYQTGSWFLAWLFLRPLRWRLYVPPKCRLTFNWLHGFIYKNIQRLTITSVRASDTTCQLQSKQCHRRM